MGKWHRWRRATQQHVTVWQEEETGAEEWAIMPGRLPGSATRPEIPLVGIERAEREREERGEPGPSSNGAFRPGNGGHHHHRRRRRRRRPRHLLLLLFLPGSALRPTSATQPAHPIPLHHTYPGLDLPCLPGRWEEWRHGGGGGLRSVPSGTSRSTSESRSTQARTPTRTHVHWCGPRPRQPATSRRAPAVVQGQQDRAGQGREGSDWGGNRKKERKGGTNSSTTSTTPRSLAMRQPRLSPPPPPPPFSLPPSLPPLLSLSLSLSLCFPGSQGQSGHG